MPEFDPIASLVRLVADPAEVMQALVFAAVKFCGVGTEKHEKQWRVALAGIAAGMPWRDAIDLAARLEPALAMEMIRMAAQRGV